MKSKIHILFLLFLPACLFSCKTAKQTQVKPKPDWVQNRPVNNEYYVGIGTANKVNGNLDYQQVAKKHAMDDMISEIKVTVSTNSVLKSVQNNNEFNQQFNSTTKITALNTVENYEVVDSWENQNEFWIYYRLSKAEYEAIKRRRMQVQIDRAEDFMNRADLLNHSTEFVQMLHMKIQALASLQNYLNEDVIGSYKGRDVKIINEIFNSIQDQLYSIQYKASVTSLKGIVGKPLLPFSATAWYKNETLIANLPLKAGSDGANNFTSDRTETDEKGVANFTKARVQGIGSIQFLRIVVDMEKIIQTDSLNPIVRSVLLSMKPPALSIRVNAEPIKLTIESEELNLSNRLEQTIIEPAVQKELVQNGFFITGIKSEADYIVRIKANTKSQGVMWGNMMGAALDITFSITDTKSGIEVYREILQNVKGFQTTPVNAGIDSYNKGINEMRKKLLPSLVNALFSGGN